MYDFIEPVIFGLLSIGIIAAAGCVVLLRRITAQALLMAFTFFCMAGMFLLLGAETIAAFQVLIYVGAITVLILFGVMFTKQDERAYALFFQRQTPWAGAVVAAIALPVIILAFSFPDGVPLAPGGDLIPLATSLFGDFAFPFEVASVLLLAALVGAIVLVKRDDDEEPTGPAGEALP
ncbi:MAG TPA: NADH-quinone oxidoreductase subunit J [Candidatus Saccharimonadales bacterium]|nr:NADH-quinone oxidoreductase subunit J [Candidatus Saccharimonadales bacterium]